MNTMRSRRSARRCAPHLETFEPRTLLSLLNGGFEEPRLTTTGSSAYRYGPTDGQWFFSADAAGVAADHSAFTSGNANAPEGIQVGFLKRTGQIQQDVSDMAPGTYQLTFSVARRANWGGAQDFRVTVDGVTVGTFDATSTDYRSMTTAPFTVAAGGHSIAFVGINSRGGDNTALLDSVRLVNLSAGLQQGDFELPALPANAYRYTPVGSAWSFTTDSGLAAAGSAFTSGNPPMPEGRQVAFLKRTGQIRQVVSGLSPGTHQFTFEAARRANWGGSEDFRVTVDGVTVGTFNATSTNYLPMTTAPFTVAAGAHTIAFVGINSHGGDNTVLLDNVRLIEPPPPGLQEDGFELPRLTTASFRYTPVGSAWSFTTDAGLAASGSAFTSGNPPLPEGRQVAFLKRTGQIRQVVNGLDPATYQITFSAARRANWGGSEDFRVTVDGVTVGTFDATKTAYRRMFTNTFTVSAGAHEIAFEGINSRGGDNTVLLDDVQIIRSEAFETAATGSSLAAVNLAYNGFFSAGPSWTDLTKQIVGWGRYSSPWAIDPSIPLDARGYPTIDAAAGTPMVGYPLGNYALSYEGTGEVSISGLGRLVGGITNDSGIKRGTVLVDRTYDATGSQLYIYIRNVDPTDPIRNLRLIMPGYDPANPPTFTNEILERLRPFSTIRFMDWFYTNNSTRTNWADRTSASSFLQGTSNGVAYEYAIELANAARKDVWLNVPVRATDDYVRQLANLVRDRLHPDLHVYIEYTNEIWNYGFRQSSEVLAVAKANPLLTASGDYERTAQQAALRTVEIGRIFRQEFGDRAERIRPILGGQAVWTHFLQTGLEYLAARVGPPSTDLFGIAIAPYQTAPGSGTPGLTLDQFFQRLAVAPEQVWSATVANKALADQFGLPLLAYEGGLSINSPDGVNRAVKRAALDDPRMAVISRDAYAAWIQGGGGMFTQYTLAYRPADWGLWGLLTTMNQIGSPRHDGMMAAFLTAGDADRDADVDYDDFRILAANYRRPGRLWWAQGDFNLDNLVNDADLELFRKHARGLTPDQANEVALLGLPVASAVNASWAMRGVRDPALEVSWRIERAGVLMASASSAMFDWRPTVAGSYTIRTTARRADGTTATRSHNIVVG